ncbi:MAG TPA: ATP-binding protein [bacterium]|nr:ATP-binding protein [bacterium]
MVRVRRRLEKKFTLFFLVFMFLCIGATAGIAIDISVRMLMKLTYESLSLHSEKVASDVTREIVMKLSSLSNFAKVQLFLPVNTDEMRERFFQFLIIQPYITKGQYIDRNGQEVFEISQSNRLLAKGRDFSRHSRFIIANVNGTYISPVYTNEHGKRSLLLSCRVGNSLENSRGVIVIEISLVHLLRLIEEENTQERIIFIVDNRGDVVAYPNYSWVLKRRNLSEIPTVQEVVSETARSASRGHVYTSADGIRVFGVRALVPYLGWGVVIEQPYVFIMQPIVSMIRWIVAISFTVSLSGVIVGVAFVRRKMRPLRILHDSAEKIQGGDLNIVIKTKTGDEIEDLANAFNAMTARLREVYGGLETKIVERTRQLEETRERLIFSERLATIGKLAGIVGHELRNPLAIMKNSIYYLNMLEIGKFSEEAKEQLDLIEKEIDNSTQIISDILDFAREKEPHLARASVHIILKSVLDKITFPRDVTVKTSFAAAGHESMVDAVLIGRVFYNLITNALQAMTGGGALSISTASAGAMVSVAFKDSGCGISPENLHKIFEPLFSTKAKGTGLGLTICKSIIERHGGRLDVESIVNIGTTFTVTLPVIPKEIAADKR